VRVAWTGAWVGDIERGSVAVLAGHLLMGMLERGVEVDFYLTGSGDELPEQFLRHKNLRVIDAPVRWSEGRLYSKTFATAFLSSLVARAITQLKLSLRLVRNHRRRPYDCVFQFSQTELLLLGPLARWLPPIVVHPSTTAAAELEWHKRESAYARRYESFWEHYLVRVYLELRTAVQRRQLKQTALVIAASSVFEQSIQQHYDLPPSRTALLPHPVALDYYASVRRPEREQPHTAFLFAARLSVRKGVELVVDLTHRLDDLAPGTSISVLGATSPWSDYSGHLADMNPRVGRLVQPVRAPGMRDAYGAIDAVLVPSHFEPFSLVTAEALASGIPVVASSAIGAVEGLDREVCRVFEAGNAEDLERCVRELVSDLNEPGGRERLAEAARREAREHFSPDLAGDRLVAILTGLTGAEAGIGERETHDNGAMAKTS
jgi:glycosyltransferase involved in cell wall biosynthesis